MEKLAHTVDGFCVAFNVVYAAFIVLVCPVQPNVCIWLLTSSCSFSIF